MKNHQLVTGDHTPRRGDHRPTTENVELQKNTDTRNEEGIGERRGSTGVASRTSSQSSDNRMLSQRISSSTFNDILLLSDVNQEEAASAADDDRERPTRSKGCRGVLDACKSVYGVVVPYGGFLVSSFNLISTTIGAGIIALPAAFNSSGIVLGSILLLIIAIGTVYSLHVIAKVIHITGMPTYPDAARNVMGRGADYITAVLMFLLCFGGSVAYIATTKTLLHPILTYPGSPHYLTTESGHRLMTSVVWLVLMLPLVILKRINSLRYFSTLGVLFIVYFVVCIVVHSSTNGLLDGEVRKDIVLFQSGNSALGSLGSFMFFLLCQLNAFEIYNETRKKTVFHFTLYSVVSVMIVTILYLTAGVFGYLDFGKLVTDSVLNLYNPVNVPYIAVGYIGVLFKLCVAFALHMIPLRDSVYHVLKWNTATVPYWKHFLVMSIPTTAALLCGLYLPRVKDALDLTGSVCGGMIGFVLPALFFMYCGSFTVKGVGILHYVGTYLLLFSGVIVVVFGTCISIYGLVKSLQ